MVMIPTPSQTILKTATAQSLGLKERELMTRIKEPAALRVLNKIPCPSIKPWETRT